MGPPPDRTGRAAGALLPAAVIAGATLAALSGWEATLSRYSTTAHWGVLAVIAAAVLGALAAGRGRQRRRSGDWAGAAVRALRGRAAGDTGRGPAAGRSRWSILAAGVAVWIGLAAAAIGWDLYSFLVQSHQLPTLSRLFGDVTDHSWGRGLVFAAWAALGSYLAVGWRRPTGPRRSGRRHPSVDGALPVADTRR